MFKIEIKTGGSAFRSDYIEDKHGNLALDPEAHEVRRLLKEVSEKIARGYDSGVLMDLNGNKVGSWSYK